VKSRWKGLANLKIHFPPETGSFPSENRHSNRRQGAGRTARAWRGARPPAKESHARGVAGVRRGAHGRGAVQSAAAGEGIACARGRRCGAQGARLGQQVARGSASVERGRRRRSQAHAGPPEREAAVRGAVARSVAAYAGATGAAGAGMRGAAAAERGRARGHRRSALARGSAGIRPSWAENTLFPTDSTSLTRESAPGMLLDRPRVDEDRNGWGKCREHRADPLERLDPTG